MARLMTKIVTKTLRAARRIDVRHCDHVFVHVALVHVVQMTVVQIVHMVSMADGGVPTAQAMNVIVIVMLGVRAARHGCRLQFEETCDGSLIQGAPDTLSRPA